MKFAKNLLLIFLLGLGACSQDHKQEIETEFTAYLTSLEKGEFEESLNYLVPEFFEIVPRSQLLEVMEQTFHNPDFVFEIKNPKILSVGEVRAINDKHYALLTYSNQLNMRFTGDVQLTSEDIEMRNEVLMANLKEGFGAENVGYNRESGFFEIQAEKRAYAISANGKNNWKFLVLEEEQKPILTRLLPAELAEDI